MRAVSEDRINRKPNYCVCLIAKKGRQHEQKNNGWCQNKDYVEEQIIDPPNEYITIYSVIWFLFFWLSGFGLMNLSHFLLAVSIF